MSAEGIEPGASPYSRWRGDRRALSFERKDQSIGLFLAINGYLLARHGQTVGKRLIRTRIVGVSDEAIPPFSRLMALRVLPLWIVNYIPVVGPLLIFVDALFVFRSDKRCVHDLIAGTKVVNA